MAPEEGPFVTKPTNAAPFLFMFVNHPGMNLTNNESERMLRKVVIARKIRFRMASRTGARMVSNIMICMLTWRKEDLKCTCRENRPFSSHKIAQALQA